MGQPASDSIFPINNKSLIQILTSLSLNVFLYIYLNESCCAFKILFDQIVGIETSPDLHED